MTDESDAAAPNDRGPHWPVLGGSHGASSAADEQYYVHLSVPAARTAPLRAGLLGAAAAAVAAWAVAQFYAGATPNQEMVYLFGVLALVLAAILASRGTKELGVDLTHEGVIVTEPRERLIPWGRIRRVDPGQRGRQSTPVTLELTDGRSVAVPGTRYAVHATRESVVREVTSRMRRAHRLARAREESAAAEQERAWAQRRWEYEQAQRRDAPSLEDGLGLDGTGAGAD